MENSMNSTSRSLSPASLYEGVADDDETPEESSWTMYLEDFSNNNNGKNSSSSSSSDMNYQSSSLVSDPACSAATRHVLVARIDHHHHHHKSCNNKLSLIKKTKIKGSAGLVDDDLEDTASSPANSPKVCNLVKDFDKNLKQKERHFSGDQRKCFFRTDR